MKIILLATLALFASALVIGLQPAIALVIGAAVFYFLPWLVALGRHKRNTVAIFLLNLLLGWTLIGWVIALVWAATDDAPSPAAIA